MSTPRVWKIDADAAETIPVAIILSASAARKKLACIFSVIKAMTVTKRTVKLMLNMIPHKRECVIMVNV